MFVRHFGSRVVLASEKVKFFPHPPTPGFGALVSPALARRTFKTSLQESGLSGRAVAKKQYHQAVSLVGQFFCSRSIWTSRFTFAQSCCRMGGQKSWLVMSTPYRPLSTLHHVADDRRDVVCA